MNPARCLRLLIVDDSEEDAELLVRHFSRSGYTLTFERVDTRPATLFPCKKAGSFR